MATYVSFILLGMILPFVSPYAHLLGQLSARQDPYPWIPASQVPGSVRSPCPGTNTLANHGFINRDGKNITRQAYQQAFLDAFQMAFVSTDSGAINALNLCSKLTKVPCHSFDLDMLSTPHAIEHDASLTRDDLQMAYGLASNAVFNQTIWNQTLAAFGAVTHVNFSTANTARVTRVEQAMLDDAPGWFIRANQTSANEAAFYLYTMNDPSIANWSVPQARLDWINHWFVNEELPTALGWTKPSAFPVADNGKGYILSLKGRVLGAKTIPPSSTPTTSLTSTTASTTTTETTVSTTSSALTSLTGYKPQPAIAKTSGALVELFEDPAIISKGQSLAQRPNHSAIPSSMAAAVATAQASPAPELPDAYHVVVTPERFEVLDTMVDSHIQEVKRYFRKALETFLGPP